MDKKSNQSEKGSCRPVSILPNLSEVFERCLYKQISECFKNCQNITVVSGNDITHSTV